ncbi:MAG: NADH-quinone oxidoreductase subunit C [Deltaproteobacteria bacterium]|nr:NADH-quinone oxidoreductase subunit C [Deltaproteobacteria bacterium]
MSEIHLSQDEEAIIAALKDRVEKLEPAVEKICGQLSLGIEGKDLTAVCRVLKEHPAMQFDYLADLCGVDYLGKHARRFQVVYNLYSISLNHRVRIKVDLQEGEAIDSVTKIWNTANWHERELFDLFGIEVLGHPDLKRILMPEGWEGHPLRKDYPLQGKGQREDFSFIPENERPPTRRPKVRSEEW